MKFIVYETGNDFGIPISAKDAQEALEKYSKKLESCERSDYLCEDDGEEFDVDFFTFDENGLPIRATFTFERIDL